LCQNYSACHISDGIFLRSFNGFVSEFFRYKEHQKPQFWLFLLDHWTNQSFGVDQHPKLGPHFSRFFLPATATALQGGHNSPSPVSWPSSCHKNFMVQKSVPTLRFRSRNLSWTFRTGAAAAVQKTRRSNRKMIYPLVN